MKFKIIEWGPQFNRKQNWAITKNNCFIWMVNHFRTLRKMSQFHLFSWCGNLMQRHSVCRVSGDSPETMWKLYLSTKFPLQEIRWNNGILRSVTMFYSKTIFALLPITLQFLLTLSWRRSLSYRNQSIDLFCKPPSWKSYSRHLHRLSVKCFLRWEFLVILFQVKRL